MKFPKSRDSLDADVPVNILKEIPLLQMCRIFFSSQKKHEKREFEKKAANEFDLEYQYKVGKLSERM